MPAGLLLLKNPAIAPPTLRTTNGMQLQRFWTPTAGGRTTMRSRSVPLRQWIRTAAKLVIPGNSSAVEWQELLRRQYFLDPTLWWDCRANKESARSLDFRHKESNSDRNVSCMVWNKVSKDMLAVGYGQFEFGGQKHGLVGFWSLKNPWCPHAILHTKTGVPALDLASLSPSLLAAMELVLKHVTEGVKLSCLIFSEESPIICIAGSSGSINVLRLVGFDRLDSDEDEMQKLKDALTTHVKINV